MPATMKDTITQAISEFLDQYVLGDDRTAFPLPNSRFIPDADGG